MSEFGPRGGDESGFRAEPVDLVRTGFTTEGESIHQELPQDTPQCLMSNGDCPTSCPLYPRAVELTAEHGAEFMRERYRKILTWNPDFYDKISTQCALEQAEGQTDQPQI